MPAASARTSPSATAWLSPKISVLTASFMAAPVPERAEVEDGPRQRLEDRPRPLEVRGLAADHDRQLAALGEPDAARDRGVEEAGAGRGAARRRRTDRGRRHGRPCHVDGRSRGARPASRPSGPP